MKRLALSILALALAANAQDRGTWRALSKTAMSITGDLSFGNEKVSINFSGFPIAQIRTLTPEEIAALFGDEGGTGDIYRLSVPGTKKLVGKNTLCGSEDTEWMITDHIGKELHVAFFSGAKIPTLTPEAMANTTTLCGTYTYAR